MEDFTAGVVIVIALDAPETGTSLPDISPNAPKLHDTVAEPAVLHVNVATTMTAPLKLAPYSTKFDPDTLKFCAE